MRSKNGNDLGNGIRNMSLVHGMSEEIGKER
jgi:hypothetical protein